MTTLDAREVLRDWDAQQAAYIAGREERFAAMLDVLELTAPTDERLRVVDLACGPGSLSERVLLRFPDADVVGIDCDPVLLAIGRAALAEYGDRLRLLDADLLTPIWPDAVIAAFGGRRPHAAVSTTALHWLRPREFERTYEQALELLAPGGLLLNGDHLRFDEASPTLRQISSAHDHRTQSAAFEAGAQTWDAWWNAVRANEPWVELAIERDRRFADRPAPPTTTVEFHLAALHNAGFAEYGTVWQLLDDYVVFGRGGQHG